jgi:outer membrane lipoprotein LolB
MSVRVEGVGGAAARSLNANFELQGDAQTGSLNLATPLGTVLAQARWAPRLVVLATPQGESTFTDLDALTREVLGETVPVVALFDWLRGRPWPGAVSTPLVAANEPGFQQLGWAVNLARFDRAAVTAQREQAPSVTVRAQLDR